MVGGRGGSPRLPPSSTFCPASPALPWVPWASVPHRLGLPVCPADPRSYAPLRRPPPPRGVLRLSRVRRSLGGIRFFTPSQVPGPHHLAGLGDVLPRLPDPAPSPGALGLSQVPEGPLCTHAPLSDPGGVLTTRPCVARTAAFRGMARVGFALALTCEAIPLTTTRPISGRNNAACFLTTPGVTHPLQAMPAGALPTAWLGVSRVGFEPCAAGSHPLGHDTEFHERSPHPLVSGFLGATRPWLDLAESRGDNTPLITFTDELPRS
jgi:hypothetical protein